MPIIYSTTDVARCRDGKHISRMRVFDAGEYQPGLLMSMEWYPSLFLKFFCQLIFPCRYKCSSETLGTIPTSLLVICRKHCNFSSNYNLSKLFSALYNCITYGSLPIIQWTIDCSLVKDLPKVGFVIGSQTFTLTGEQYTLTVRPCSMNACMAIHTPFNMLDCLLHTELVQYSNIVLDTI